MIDASSSPISMLMVIITIHGCGKPAIHIFLGRDGVCKAISCARLRKIKWLDGCGCQLGLADSFVGMGLIHITSLRKGRFIYFLMFIILCVTID